MIDPKIIEAITSKVKEKKKLTLDEERIYMREVLKYPDDEIERIIAITENKNPNIILD
jgi:hypothetical protein